MRVATDALLLRKRDHGEADLVTTLLTCDRGVVFAIAFSARKSRKRFAVLEPFHTMRVELDVGARDLATLRAATVTEPRTVFLHDLDRMRAAARAFVWIRRTCPADDPVPDVWAATCAFLDDETSDALAIFGLTLLRLVGLSPRSVRSGMSAEEVVQAVETIIAEQGLPG